MLAGEAPTPSTGASVVVSPSVSEAEWDRYVNGHPEGTGYHLVAWRRIFEEALGHETIYLSGYRDRRIVGVLPLVRVSSWLFGRALVSLPFLNYGGVLSDDDVAGRALIREASREAARRRLHYVELRHTTRQFSDLPFNSHKVAMTLGLRADVPAMWNALNNKVRNQIRKAQKSEFETVVGGQELLDEFYGVFARNMRDLGTPVFPYRLFRAVLASIDRARVYSIRLRGQSVAAGITLGYRDSVENVWASSLREHRALCPNMLLYWTMIEDAIRSGYRVFDFGRSTPGEGTYQFKKQWGAVETSYHWEYALNGSSTPPAGGSTGTVALARRLWTRLPVPVANALGPLISRSCSLL